MENLVSAERHVNSQDSASRRVAVLFSRFGPYHCARINAVAGVCSVVGVEYVESDSTYAWEEALVPQNFKRVTLFKRQPIPVRTFFGLVRRLSRELDLIKPSAVAIPGWSDACSLAALVWCGQEQVPAVLMSDSVDGPGRRPPWKEAIKRRIIPLYGAGLVAGDAHADYLARLGMPRERIFAGYDVVDNDYFEREAEAARSDARHLRQKHGLPDRYILCSARFIEEKNLPNLLRAYARYRQISEASRGATRHDGSPWDLVLVGDGPLRSAVVSLRSSLGLGASVHLPGFKQYPELPIYYGLSGLFVLPSISETWGLVVNEAMASGLPVLVSKLCGCVSEIVSEGQNGFSFDPGDTEQLAQLMHRLTGDTKLLSQMGTASRELIKSLSLGAFSSGLLQAVNSAASRAPRRVCMVDKLVLWGLIQSRPNTH